MEQCLHDSVTASRVMEIVESGEYTGVCVACGEDSDAIEPDARELACPHCGAESLHGAEQILIEGLYHDEEGSGR